MPRLGDQRCEVAAATDNPSRRVGTTRDALESLGVYQLDFEPSLLKDLEQWNPVHPGRLHRHGLRCGDNLLIKIGARLVRHARRLVFQFAEVAVPRDVFRQVLERIDGLHPAPG